MSDTNGVDIGQVATIIAAYLGNNHVPAAELPALISGVYGALANPAGQKAPEPAPVPLTPAVPIKKSITPDYLISLEDGKKFKSLKRYLATSHGMSPDDYRKKWGLPGDYPMVAPNYAAARSALARTMGLGRKRGEPVPTPALVPEPVAEEPNRRGRARKAA